MKLKNTGPDSEKRTKKFNLLHSNQDKANKNLKQSLYNKKPVAMFEKPKNEKN